MQERDFDAEIAGLKESVFAARQAATSAHREMVEQSGSWFAEHALAVTRKNVELQHERSETIGDAQVKALRDDGAGIRVVENVNEKRRLLERASDNG